MFLFDIFTWYLYVIYIINIGILNIYSIFIFNIDIYLCYLHSYIIFIFPNWFPSEPKPLHIVNTTLDMPEGVTLSDSEDKDGKYDPNDPHRALDIELDM